MPKILYLFPDTNVFVQCRALEELDWHLWPEFDEIHLIVSRPVQSEIDAHKNKGKDRLARRARKASSIFRDIIVGDDEYRLVRTNGPTVKLFINAALYPSHDIADRLDYNNLDDQLVGTVHAFAQQNPDDTVQIFTHDTGPMASAKMLGVAITPVPDDWLLPPEPSESNKRIQTLEVEIARLKDKEPKFAIACIGARE